MSNRVIEYNCEYCFHKNIAYLDCLDEYQFCVNCDGIHDIEVDENGEVKIEAF